MNLFLIDNNFYRCSTSQALALCGRLPHPGWEKSVPAEKLVRVNLYLNRIALANGHFAAHPKRAYIHETSVSGVRTWSLHVTRYAGNGIET